MNGLKTLTTDIFSNTYRILKLVGAGGFGKVYKCLTFDTKEIAAVKIIPNKYGKFAENELKAYMRLREHGNHENIVTLNRHFIIQGSYVLEFEMFDMTLDNFIIENGKPLDLREIQAITHQIVMALKTLSDIGMVHMDIKPDNIMLVDHKYQPLKVKLIDFGMYVSVDKLTIGDKMQVMDYRAPEIILGLPLNEAVDMWSLGCVVAFMFCGEELYSPKCEYDRMRELVQLGAQPADKLLNTGIYSSNFFYFNLKSFSWELLSESDCHVNGHSPTNNVIPFHMLTSLDDIVKARPNTTENENMPAFINLFKKMMEVDPNKRITPREALLHSFFKTRNFPKPREKPTIDMTAASSTECNESLSEAEESAAYFNATCSQRRPPLMLKKRRMAKPTMLIKGASSSKSDASLSTQKETASYINAECSLRRAPLKPNQGKMTMQIKDTANTNLNSMNSFQEETATCSSKESTVTESSLKFRIPKKRRMAKTTMLTDGASSTKSDVSLSNQESLKKAPAKPARKQFSTMRIELSSPGISLKKFRHFFKSLFPCLKSKKIISDLKHTGGSLTQSCISSLSFLRDN